LSGISDIRLVAALLGGLVAVGLWILARGYELFTERRQRKSVGRNFIRALYAEIDFNTRDMELFLSIPFPPALEMALREDTKLVPHIVDARHTDFYRSNISSLHHVSDDLIGNVVHFYGMLERIASQIDGLDRPAFLSISADSRITAVRRIYDTARDCEKSGKHLLDQLAAENDTLKLVRIDRDRLLASEDMR